MYESGLTQDVDVKCTLFLYTTLKCNYQYLFNVYSDDSDILCIQYWVIMSFRDTIEIVAASCTILKSPQSSLPYLQHIGKNGVVCKIEFSNQWVF